MDVFLTHVATAWSQNSLRATRWFSHRSSAARSCDVSAWRGSTDSVPSCPVVMQKPRSSRSQAS